MDTNIKPPKWAEQFFLWYCSDDLAEEICGDLHERFYRHVDAYGAPKARRKFVLNVLKFISRHTLKSRGKAEFNPLPMFKNYFKIVFRNTMKSPSYTIINVFGLALGLLCFMLISAYINDELSYDKFHSKAERICRVPFTWLFGDTKSPTSAATANVAGLMKQHLPEVEEAVRFKRGGNTIVKVDSDVFEEGNMLYADSTLWHLFDFPLIVGNSENALTAPNSLLLTERIAEKYYGPDWGASSLVGNTVTINNSNEFQIAGVISNPPANSQIQFDLLASFSSLPEATHNGHFDNSSYPTYVLLHEGSNWEAVRDKISIMMEDNFGKDFPVALDLEPFLSVYLSSVYRPVVGPGGDIKYLYIFGAIALLIIAIACINYMNLVTARSTERAKEIGLRKVLGAKRWQVFWQFIGESMIITTVALIVAIAASQLLLGSFNSLSGKELTLDNFTTSGFVLGYLSITFLVGFLSGGYPALAISSFTPSHVLKGQFKSSKQGSLLRKGLIVLQFTASIILLISTLVIYEQLNYVKSKNLGFEKENLLILPLDNEMKKNLGYLKNELKSVAGVTAVSAINEPPNRINFGTTYHVLGKEEAERQLISSTKADPDMIETVGLEIIDGRNFRDIPEDDTQYEFLMNEEAIEFFGWESQEALGKKLGLWGGGDTGTVVGVIKNFHSSSLHNEIEPVVIFSNHGTWFLRRLLVRVDGNNLPQTMASIEDFWNKEVSHRPFDFEFLDELFDRQYRTESKLSELFTVFATLAVVIGCLGLFGLASYTAIQRQKEIGVRKVLGASIFGIVKLLSGHFSVLVGISFIIAAPVAYILMRQWLGEFAYKTEISPGIVIAAGMIALIIAWLTVSAQSIKAAAANPAETLKNNE